MRLASLLAALLLAASAHAQITGTVRDAGTDLPLPGATLRLVETGRTALAGADGAFAFARVAPGRYTLRATYVGYGALQVVVTVDAAGAAAPVAFALRPMDGHLDVLLAEADAPVSAASAASVRAFDLAARPPRSAQDLLRLAPGLVTAQHAGGGKAEQIFLRGFDADHGTDVAVSVDGVPVNLVSHGHGQGYADLHFLIPETVERLDVRKGPYRAEDGDFATAGAVAFTTKDRLDAGLVRVGAGAFRTYEVTALAPVAGTPSTDAYVAGQFYTSDGPFRAPQGFVRGNAFGRLTRRLSSGTTLRVSGGGFGARWDASGQIPQRAVSTVGRFGAIDDREGGTTHRFDARAEFDAGDVLVRAYAFRYGFRLFSNFTFFLEDPAAGDMIEQRDDRTVAGVEVRHHLGHRLGARSGTLSLGAGGRADVAEVGLHRSPDRARARTLVDSRVHQASGFLWAEEAVALTNRLRFVGGLRADVFGFNVEDRARAFGANASGAVGAVRLSPKANLAWRPTDALDVFANVGAGFHSNDARAAVFAARFRGDCAADPRCGLARTPGAREALPRAVGAEVGTRVHTAGRLTVGAALWRLDLAEEFTYVGDAGTTEPSGRTRRVGLDLEGRLVLARWLAADADVSLARPRRPAPARPARRRPVRPRGRPSGERGRQRDRRGLHARQPRRRLPLPRLRGRARPRERPQRGLERGAVRHREPAARRGGTGVGAALHARQSAQPARERGGAVLTNRCP
jgi:outer membrane receptor protein involved in Fe transport